MYGVVVRGGNNAAAGEEEAGDDGGAVGREGDVFGVGLGYPAGACQEAGFEEKFERVWEGEGGEGCLEVLALAEDVLGKGAFRVAAEPDLGGFEHVAPEDGVGVDDGAPGFGDTRGAEEGGEGEVAEDLGDEFWGEKRQKVAC